MGWKNRHLSGFCIAALLYAGLPPSFHDHHGKLLRSESGPCKIVAKSCTADNAAPGQPVRPHFIPLYVFPEVAAEIVGAAEDGSIARAPPSVLSDRYKCEVGNAPRGRGTAVPGVDRP
jgi:hypothetical protein